MIARGACRASRRVLGAALLVFGLIVLSADVAPALAPLGAREAGLAAAARLALRPTCHQRPERSLTARGVPMAACARCVGLHAGAALAGAALLAGATASAAWRVRLAIVAGALAVDVVGGMAGCWDVPLVRFALGAAFAFVTVAAAVAGDAPEAHA